MTARTGAPLRVRMALFLVCAIASFVPPALAQDMPPYRDDRSNPQALVDSLYNALQRQEYLRAWSYYDEAAVEPFETFEAGYEATARLRVRTQEGTVEGAAGSLYGLVPTVIEATGADGAVTVFTGCYETRQMQPAAQIEPPFAPIRITAARLDETGEPFEAAAGECPSEGL